MVNGETQSQEACIAGPPMLPEDQDCLILSCHFLLQAKLRRNFAALDDEPCDCSFIITRQ